MPDPTYSLLPLALAVGYDTGLESAKARDPLRGAMRGSLRGLYAGTGGLVTNHLLSMLLQPSLGIAGNVLAGAGGVGAWYLLRKLIDKVVPPEERPRAHRKPQRVYLPAVDPRAFTRTVIYEG